MASNIEYSKVASEQLDAIIGRYVGFRQKYEYGISAFQFWFYQIKDNIEHLKYRSNKLGINFKFDMEYWGSIFYNRYKINDDIYVEITRFEFAWENFFNWIYNHELPNNPFNYKKKENIVRYFKPKKFKPLFNTYHIIKIYGQEKYNLLDNYGQIVLHNWFNEIRPIKSNKPTGELKIIGYVNDGGFLAALGLDGKLYKTNKLWKDMFTESNEVNFDIERLVIESYEESELRDLYEAYNN